MTPERVAGLVARWVRLYTRNLPPAVAERRIGEIAADLHDHIAHERARGTSEGRIARGIAARMLRGLPADASWRTRHSTRKDPTMRKPAVRVALVTALILLVPAIAMLAGDDGTNWSVFDFVLAGVFLAGGGMLLELAARRRAGLVVRVAAIAFGALAMVLGETDDAPGLFGFGLLLIAGTVVLTFRSAASSAR